MALDHLGYTMSSLDLKFGVDEEIEESDEQISYLFTALEDHLEVLNQKRRERVEDLFNRGNDHGY